MMIENLGDWDAVGTVDRLREFVMIDQNELTGDGRGSRLGKNSSKVPVLIEHGKDELVRRGPHPSSPPPWCLGRHEMKVVVEHFTGSIALRASKTWWRYRAASDDHRPLTLGLADDNLFDLQSTCDDDGMNVLLDGKPLHIVTIADDENRLFLIQVAQPAPERLDLHSRYDQNEMTDVALGRSRQECAANRLDELLQSGTDFALQTHLARGGKRYWLILRVETSPTQRWLLSTTGRPRSPFWPIRVNAS